jgi:signal transduction histidine kinase
MVLVGAFDMPERLSELQEISLYRAIQEWVNNILKHASATTIEIQLVGHGDELNVTIEDNGEGFDIRLLEIGNGNGWRNILSRTKLLHGEVEVDSNIGRSGTILIIRIPIGMSNVNTGESVGVQNTQ